MSQFFQLHPQNPQARLLKQTAEILHNGGVIVYPTDSGYALGCMLGQAEAQAHIRQIRQVDEAHLFTLVCRNLTDIGNYAVVSNSQFRLLKANTPGAYTFILKATREVPRKLQHPKRNTIGIRVPDLVVTQAILEAIGGPLLSMSLIMPEDSSALTEAWEIREKLEHTVDLVLDVGSCPAGETTVINLTGEVPELIRAGLGDLAPFGLE